MYVIVTGSGTRRTRNLSAWLKRNYGVHAWIGSFNAVYGSRLGSILRQVDTGTSMVEDALYNVTIDDTVLDIDDINAIMRAEQGYNIFIEQVEDEPVAEFAKRVLATIQYGV